MLYFIALQVLDMRAYEGRQKEYALKGHKHFYFMTLNGSEVLWLKFSSSVIKFNYIICK